MSETTAENRRQILEMVAAGQITADEAERLMAAMEKPEAAKGPEATWSATGGASGTGTTAAAGRARPKYMRIAVDVEEKSGKAPTKVNIRVPLLLLRSGVKLAGLMPQAARAKVEDAMRKNGFPMDLSQVKPGNLDEMVDVLQDMTIDVDEDDAKVRILFE
jgi:hypothetical protein